MLVLASASPRRSEILLTLRVRFRAVPSRVDETPGPGEAAEALARRLAREKACEVSARTAAHALGADTVVVLDGDVLGKPGDDGEARAMLRRLAGRWHEVVTGVALAEGGRVLEDLAVTTRVRFVPMDEARIDAYVATGEGRDKAGAYAVQGIAAGLVDRVEGSFSNVVGLPAAETIALLERHGLLAGWP